MAEARQRGLGRGLSALLGESDPVVLSPGPAAAVRDDGAPRELPIELLRRNPDQPRRHFTEADMEELADSIRANGVLQPILVRPAPGAPGEYQIVAGERRWRAAQRASLHLVPVLVRELTDAQVLEMAIVENVQRADLDPIEEASGYQTLMDRFGHTQAGVAQVVGKSRPHVANALRLLALPAGVREHLQAGRLSAGHARAIASAPDPARLAEEIVAKGLSVRQAESLGRGGEASTPRGARTAPAAGPKSADLRALEGDLSEVLGMVVEVADRDGSGRVTVSYGSLEQLDEICRRLMG
ncbi:MAG: ParB/RepB/Spo0J family partition protein [Caulobacteraceae bacterium]|nr:ParB/RepB/Spo0J family partition protein [Caulobacter sp.]